MLHFEHTIVINEPRQPGHERIDIDSLWKALVFRARYPGHFNPALKCRLLNEQDHGFTRVIIAGEMELHDEVTLIPRQEIRTLIDGRHQSMHAESVTRIEQPAPGALQVRFIYRRDSLGEQGGIDADAYLKSAYVQNDREAVATIRQMIADGWSAAHM